MDGLLKLIDALRERGAIKITTQEVSVEFASPMATPVQVEPEMPVFEKPIDTAELEKLLYVETAKM